MTPLVTLLITAALPLAADSFSYDRTKPFDTQVTRTETRAGGVEVRDITFANLAGGRTEAFLILPPQTQKRTAGILFVHWYEPPDPTSNRTQFVDEAVEMARRGAVSLLPATMWSDFEWFPRRRREEDLTNTIAQIRELRRALDLLLSQPNVESSRVAYVGHDFGAMVGAVLAGVDGRSTAWALQAGTTRWSNWYLFGPPMQEPQRTGYLRSLRPIDPIEHIAKAAPDPVLLQFATRDFFVPHDVAEEFWQAARQPKEIIFYDAEHKMNDQARADRIEWLTRALDLEPRQ